jgi:hypothetical protein
MSNPQKKHNWLKISKEYIEGHKLENGDIAYPTLEELSTKYNIHHSIVRKHSTNEHWRDKRATFEEGVVEAARKASIKKRAKDVEVFNDDCYSISNTGLWHLKKTLETHLKEKGQTAMPLPSLESLTRSLERLQKVEAQALGMPGGSMALSGPKGGPIEVEVSTITGLIKEAHELEQAKRAEAAKDSPKKA